MCELFVITSVINISKNPFTYTNNRSIFSCEERFEQTKNTINTIKEKVPNVKILIVECSDLNEEYTNYLINNVDYLLNLYDDIEIRQVVEGLSKSSGENTLLLSAINYINNNNIEYNNFYKISGRYWLNEYFDYNNFNNDKIIYFQIKNHLDFDINTSLYKIPKIKLIEYENYIKNEIHTLNDGFAAEFFFGYFLKTIEPKYKLQLEQIGISGYIAVRKDFFIKF